MKEEYIVYCDESAKKGKYFGNMFRPVCYIANDLTDNQINNEYYLLYYQFVKWAFGFENSIL